MNPKPAINHRARAVLSLIALLVVACSFSVTLPDLSQLSQGAGSTAQAVITQAQGDLNLTLQAITPGANRTEAPKDIPVLSDATGFYGNPTHVLYMTTTSLKDVTAFYKQQMPDEGWAEASSDDKITEHSALLTFKKEDRTATVILTASSSGVSVDIDIKQEVVPATVKGITETVTP
jgi:hypothetical protein